ncbi:MAG: ABC transporter ATP-binding protein [Fibrobacterota bacterium]
MKSFSLYRRMLGFMRPHIHWFILSALLSILIVSLDALSLWITATLFTTLFSPEAIEVARPEFSLGNLNEILKYYTYQMIQGESKLDSLKMVCVLMLVAFLGKDILVYVKSLIVSLLNLKMIRDMRNNLYQHVLKLPITYYDRNKSGSIVSLLVNDLSRINISVTNTLDKLLIEPIRLISFVTILFIISSKLTLVIFCIYPILGFLIVTIGKIVRRRSKRSLISFSGMISVLTETINGIRAVKMFNMNETETKKFRGENTQFVKKSFRSDRYGKLSSPLTESLGVGVAVLLLWYGGRQVLTGTDFTAEDFVRFLIMLISSYQPLKTLGSVNSSLQNGIAAAERVFELMDSPVEKLSSRLNTSAPSFEKEVRFTNVSFSYPECEEQVLRNVSFTLEKGEILALVGSSGSGKSTILELLPRFYDINEGDITIDGVNIKEYDLVGLRKLFGIVSQETILFNDTVRNNIKYGNPEASEQDLFSVSQAANALEFIEKLPLGMDTMIGEKGVMLSGGQRQRLAIARALLCNPPILILDEATSALDTESEKLVQQAINRLMSNRTALVVAHRLSTIQHANKIIVLDNGRIVESGSHVELLEKDGKYKYFYDIQFATS